MKIKELLYFIYIVFCINLFSFPAQGQEIKIISPVSGSKLTPGANIDIMWSNPGQKSVSLFYSYDNSNWELIGSGLTGESYNWTIPQNQSADIFFRITYLDYETPLIYWHNAEAHIAEIRSCFFTQSGKFILTASADGFLKLWNFENRSLDAEANIGSTGSLYFGVPCGERLAAAGSDETLVIVDFDDPAKVIRQIDIGAIIRGVDYSPVNGGMIAAAAGDGFIHIYGPDGGFIRKIKAVTQTVLYTVRFSQDGAFMCFAGYDGVINFADVSTGEIMRSFTGHGINNQQTVVWSVDINPTNTRIISGGVDGTLRLWDTETGKNIETYLSHTGHLRSARFSRDGKIFLSASLDGTFRQYGESDMQELAMATGSHGAQIIGADYSPQADYIVTGGRDNGFKVWRNFELSEFEDTVECSLFRQINIRIPELTAYINDSLKIPVILDMPDSGVLFDKEIYNIEMVIKVPNLMLDIEGHIVETPVKEFDTLSLDISFNISSDTIAVLNSFTLLAPYDHSKISIEQVVTEDNLMIETGDGSVTLTGECPAAESRHVEVGGGGISLNIYPNPADNVINIDLNTIEDSEYSISLHNIDGAVVETLFRGKLRKGRHTESFAIAKIPSGVYYINISWDGNTFSDKVLINK